MNVIAAPTAEEAELRSLPYQHMTARLRQNLPLATLETVEQAQASAAEYTSLGAQIMASARQKWFVGTGESVAAELAAFAERHGVDEVMLSPIAGSFECEPVDASPGRIRTLDLLAAAA